MGVAGPDSSKVVAKSRDLPTTYLLPSFSSTKSLPERKQRFASLLLFRKDRLPVNNQLISIHFADSNK